MPAGGGEPDREQPLQPDLEAVGVARPQPRVDRVDGGALLDLDVVPAGVALADQRSGRRRIEPAGLVELARLQPDHGDPLGGSGVFEQRPGGFGRVAGGGDGDPLERHPQPSEQVEHEPEGRPGAGIVVDQQERGAAAGGPPQIAPFPPRQPRLRPDRHPGDAAPALGRQVGLDQRREVGARRAGADDRRPLPGARPAGREPPRQGDDVVVRQVLTAESFRQAHPLPQHPVRQPGAGERPHHRAQLAPPAGGRRRFGLPALLPDQDVAHEIHAAAPPLPPPGNRAIPDQASGRPGQVQQRLRQPGEGSRAGDAGGDRGQVPRPPRQIVIDRTGDRADEQVEVDPALVPLPAGGKIIPAIQFLPEPEEQVAQGQDRIQAPLVVRIELPSGGIGPSGGPGRVDQSLSHRTSRGPTAGRPSSGRSEDPPRNRSRTTHQTMRGLCSALERA